MALSTTHLITPGPILQYKLLYIEYAVFLKAPQELLNPIMRKAACLFVPMFDAFHLVATQRVFTGKFAVVLAFTNTNLKIKEKLF